MNPLEVAGGRSLTHSELSGQVPLAQASSIELSLLSGDLHASRLKCQRQFRRGNVLRSVCTSLCQHTKLLGPTEKRKDTSCQYTNLGPLRLSHAFQKPEGTAFLKSMLPAQHHLTFVMVCLNLIVDLQIIVVLLRLLNEDQIKRLSCSRGSAGRGSFGAHITFQTNSKRRV